MKKAILFFCCLISGFFSLMQAKSSILLERLDQIEVGDYIVLSDGSHFIFFTISAKDADFLAFEEVTIPRYQAEKLHSSISPPFWKNWLSQNAPQHSSWEIKEIALQNRTLREGYSFSQQKWIDVQSSNSFLTALLQRELTPIPLEKRVRIGPAPAFSQPDKRPFWHPSITVEGERISSFPAQAWSLRWPADQSPLANSTIVLYFSKQTHRAIPTAFPLFLEVKREWKDYRLRVIDMGRNAQSPHSFFPRKAPRILHMQTVYGDDQSVQAIRLMVRVPFYYRDLSLFFRSADWEEKRLQPISHHVIEEKREKQQHNEKVITIEVAKERLDTCFVQGGKYDWFITSSEFKTDLFHYPHSLVYTSQHESAS